MEELNQDQLNRFSEIYMGIGHIALASIILPTLIDKLNLILLVSGLVVMFVSWFASIRVLRRRNDD